MDYSANVILPQSSPEKIRKKPYKTLYLLHGLSDDHTAWSRWTSIERYVADYAETNDLSLAVVMPNAHKSFYADLKNGDNYFTFISDELVSIMEDMFPLSNKREDRYAAGLSMGGYGAMKLGLSCPEKFSVAASLSGALDAERLRNSFSQIFEDTDESRQKNDLFLLAEKLNKSNQPKPRLYVWCGTEDFLYQDNINFKNFMDGKNFEFKYEESPGDHQWFYWDMKIKTALEFIFNQNKN